MLTLLIIAPPPKSRWGAIYVRQSSHFREQFRRGNAKANEIVAIPKLLDMLAIEGAIVTIDAMGCQRDIVEKIIDKKADYVLALKGNQGSLKEDVELFVAEQKAKGFADTRISQDTTVDAQGSPHLEFPT
jgi:predicted transposase YbfD/YdcC